MARSYTYDRPLDAKILPRGDNSNHEFRFLPLLEIKKEVENETFDAESELCTEAPVCDLNSVDGDHRLESQSLNVQQHGYDETKKSHPKLLIKFSDLLNNSGRSDGSTRKRKRSEREGLQSEILKPCEPRSNKRYKSGLHNLPEERVTRSSTLMPEPPAPGGEKIEVNSAEENRGSNKEKHRDPRMFGVISRSNTTKNFKCESCGMCFANKKLLRSHKRYYTPNVDLQCAICDIGFSRDVQLVRHNRKAHSTSENNHAYRFKCHLCTDRFERKIYLIAHVAHLHNKHFVSQKSNENPDREISLPSIRSKEKRRRGSTRRSQRNMQDTVQDDLNNLEIESYAPSDPTKDLNQSAEDQYNEEEYLTHESLSAQVKNNDPILDQPDSDAARAGPVIPSVINASIETSIEPTDVREIVQENVSTLKTQDSKIRRVLQSSPEPSEEENQVHCSQIPLEGASLNVQPQLGGDLVDDLENPVGSWCISEPPDQPNKTDHISRCSSRLATTDPEDTGSKEEMASRVRCTNSNVFQTTVLQSSTASHADSTAHLDKMLGAEKETYKPGKSISSTQYNQTLNRFDQNPGSEILKLGAHHQSEQLVGIVLSHQVADDATMKENVTTSHSSVDCNDVGLDSVQVDDFGGIAESTVIDCEDEDKSFKSESHGIGASSLSNSATDLTSLEFQKTTAVRNCDSSNDLRIRDVRVLLVKLENMLDLSKKSNTPKSSSLGTCSLIKTEISDVHPYKKILPNLMELRQYSNRKHNGEKIRYTEESRSGTQRNCKTASDCPNVFLDYNAIQHRDEMKKGKFTRNQCYFCEEVFRNNFSATSHYLSLHTKIGDFQCCLCYESFKNLRSLRNHVYRNHNACAQKKAIISCLVCKEKLSNPSSSQRCLKCDRGPESRSSGSRREQFVDKQDLTENNCAYTFASRKLETSENVSMSSLTKLHRLSLPNREEESHSVASVVYRESANTDAKYSLAEPCKEGFKNFKCSACDQIFFHSEQLTEHLTTGHTGVEYSNLEIRQNVVEPQTPEYSASLSRSKKPKNQCRGVRIVPKFSVGKKRKLKHNEINHHDKFCKKKLSIRQKLKPSHVNGSQRYNQREEKRRDTKTCYDYRCYVCGLNCCCRKNLKIHKRRYSTTGNNVCNICGLTSARKHLLVTHMKTAHNPKVAFHGRIRCEICNQGFYNEKFLRIHLAHFHRIKYLQCRDCRIIFDTRWSLEIHRKYYSVNVSYPCSICDQTFRCKYLLKYHTAQAHNGGTLKAYKYSCDTCRFSFVDKCLLQAHIGHFHNAQNNTAQTREIDENVRGSPPPQNSAECSELAVKSREVSVHLSVKSNNTTRPEIANENDQAQEITAAAVNQTVKRNTPSEYKCNICKLSFIKPYDILNHEWEFSNEGAYACNVCNRKFMTDSHLKNHRIKHYERTVGGNHKCHVCKEDFSGVDDLRMHGLHLHGPQFVWERVSETTDETKSSATHSRIEHAREANLKKLPSDQTCDTPGLITSNKVSQNGKILLFQKVVNYRSFLEPQRPHSNENIYCCDFCGTNFNSESLLKYHNTKHFYHAYHSSSSRYLCLICKNKFRTNDILRAHVIHCHTSNNDAEYSNPSHTGCSKSDANNHVEEVGSTYNEAANAALTLPNTPVNKNQPYTPEKPERNRLPMSKSPSPSKRVQLTNTSRNVGDFGNDHSYFAPFTHGIECEIIKDLGHRNSQNCNTIKTTDSTSFDSSSGEVEVFIIRVKDLVGSDKYACSICLDVFQSIALFREHFAEDHVRNEAYRCTLCDKKFSLISALNDHTVKHRPSNFVCCGKKFKQAADFICHRFSHNSQTEEKGNSSKQQGSPGGNVAAYLDGSDDESKYTDSWKCEVCDEVFLDVDVMLKHWDVCINANGLQCDMCRAMFKNSDSLQVHKMTYHKNRHQNRSTVHNRSKLPENSTRTRQTATATQTKTMPYIQPENKGSTLYSENTHVIHKIAKVLASTDTFAKENDLFRHEKKSGKPIAKILPNSQNQNEGCDGDPRSEINTASSTKVNPELPKAHGVCITSEHDPLKISHGRISVKHLGKTICLKRKDGASKQTNPQIRHVMAPVLKKNPCMNQNSLLNYFSVQDSRDSHKPQSVQNDSGTRFRQNKCKERKLTSQQHTPSTVQNLASMKSAGHNSNNIQNGEVLIDCGRKFLPTNHNDIKSLKLPTASSNTASNMVYYVRIPALIDNTKTTENETITPSNGNQKADSSNCSDKILSGLVPIPLNTPTSSNVVFSIPPVPENSCQSSNRPIDSNFVDLGFNSNNHARKKLPHLPSKSSSIVINPVCVFDKNRITNVVHSNRHENDSGIRSPSNDGKGVKVPLLPATSGTSTRSVLLVSNEITKGLHSLSSTSASKIDSIQKKDLTQKNYFVRCNYCNLSFTEQSKLVEHMNSHKTDNQCPACGLNFSNGSALEQHLPEHQSSKCTKCKMAFFFSDSIAHPAGTRRYCSSCNSLLPSPTQSNNRTKNSGRQIMKCGICMDAFGTMSEMTVHFKQVHSSFVCGICESKFSMKTTLLSHMQTHGNASPETTQCKTCDKYFNGKLELAYHELSH